MSGKGLKTAQRSAGILIAVALLASRLPADGADQPPPAARVDADGNLLPAGAFGRFGTVCFTHQGLIEHVAYSPDGKTLASSGRDGMVRLWDSGTGKQLWCGERGGQWDYLAFSPDGKLLAWNFRHNVCQIADARTGKSLRRLDIDDDYIGTIAFSPDSRRLATGSTKKAVKLWDVTSGEEVRTPAAQVQGYWAIAFSPDGKLLASDGADNAICVWDLSSGKSLRTLKWYRPSARPSTGDGTVLSLAFSPDGKYLAAGCRRESDGEVVHVWEVSGGKKLDGFLAGAGWANSVAFSPDGTTLATGSRKVGVTLWSVPCGKSLRKLAVFAESLSFAPDGRTLATGDNDYIRFWDVETGKERRLRRGHTEGVLGVAFAKGGGVLATASYDATIRLWDVKSRKESLSVKHDFVVPRPSHVFCSSIWISENGRRLLYAKADDAISLRDVSADKEVREYRTGGDLLESFAVSPDQKTVAVRTCGPDGLGKSTIHLYDFTTGEKKRSFEDPPDRGSWHFPGQRLVFSPDSATLASADHSRMIHLWDVATGKELRQLRGHERAVHGLAFSPAGRVLASAAGDFTVTVGSTTLDNLYTDTTLRFWDVSTGRELLSIKNEGAPVYAVSFSRDGKLVAAGDKYGSISVREVATGQELLRFRNPRGRVYSLAFAPNGASLVSGMSDGTILQWDTAPPRSRTADDKNLDALWADLGSAESTKAYRAVWALAATPEGTIRFLQSHLKPIPPVKPERIRELVAALDDDDFAKREAATKELRHLGKQAEDALRTALANTKSEEVRKRAEPLVKALEGWVITDPNALREVRAIWVLQRIDTHDAKAILEGVGRGAPELRTTQEAKDAAALLRRKE